uniref:Uncharacterized protein n=1 Tax=Anopheles arabiensis TaxID=7173 RepID=A0A182IF10_ANOAR
MWNLMDASLYYGSSYFVAAVTPSPVVAAGEC